MGAVEEVLLQRKASAALSALQAAASVPSFDHAGGAHGMPPTLRGLPRALSLPGLEPPLGKVQPPHPGYGHVCLWTHPTTA